MNKVYAEEVNFVEPWKVFVVLKNIQGVDNISFLDSSLNNGNGGRFSLLAWEPFSSFSFENKRVLYKQNGKKIQTDSFPLEFLEDILKKYSLKTKHFFSPGAIGFFSYDFAWNFEKLPSIKPDDINIPECFFLFYDRVLVFDHFDKKVHLFISDIIHKNDFSRYRKEIVSNILSIIRKSQNIAEPIFAPQKVKKIYSQMDKNYYLSSIKKIRKYIEKGDVYQINFAHHIKGEIDCCSESVYSMFRKINPTGYSAYFDAGDFVLLSNSPEMFFKKDGQKITTRPMKGTRKRTGSMMLDNKFKRELKNSNKEKAELLMIVDLERNDLGRICAPGSVKVTRFPILEEYNTVFQMTAEIEGYLNTKKPDIRFISSIFPSGSVTGAPKIRAMEIIEETEIEKRGFYTGSFGFLGFNNNMEFNILIRSMLLKSKKFWYPVGGGIVWDSQPEKEYEETMVKAKNLFLSLGVKNDREMHI